MNDVIWFVLGMLCGVLGIWSACRWIDHPAYIRGWNRQYSVRPQPPTERPSGPAPQPPPGPPLSSSEPVLIPRGKWFAEPDRCPQRRN